MRSELIETLNELIQLDFDAVKAYERAIDFVDDPEVEEDLEAFLLDHERHITDLAQLVRELGGTPIELGRDLKGFLLEGMTVLRSTLGTLGALRAMRTNEKLTNRRYEKVLAHDDLPTHARAIVAVNFEDERRHLRVIERHLERLARTVDDDAVRADKPHVRL